MEEEKIKLLHCLLFSISKKGSGLRKYWRHEIIRRNEFLLYRLLMQANNNRRRNFLFWWRLANEMYIYGSKKQKKTGLWINRKLNSKFGIDIELGAVKREIRSLPSQLLFYISPWKYKRQNNH